jgi:geranylgeranyl reductase family protein
MAKYDVVVVGAGPAGATAAYYLASAGVKVCLVDKQTFPRDKVCGDGAVATILTQLERIGLSDWLAQNSFNAPKELLFSAPNGAALHFKPADAPSKCYGRVIPRLELDNAILGQAIKAGADLWQGIRPTYLDRRQRDKLRLTGISQRNGADVQLESTLLITADGAHASFTKTLGLIKAEPDLVAVRTYFENVAGSESLLELHFDSTLTPGYAWLFPLKDSRANVGLGTYVSRSRQRNVNLKQLLPQFIKTNPYAQKRLSQARMAAPIRGYPLRSQMNRVIPVADNILVAGEAAGLVNPLNGEGIGTAMTSGELAAYYAKAALEAGNFSKAYLTGYATALQRQIGRVHFWARLLRGMLAWPVILNRAVQRAQYDRAFAQSLFEVIVELRPPQALLAPGFVAKLLAG